MRICRIVAWVLVLAACAAVGWDLAVWAREGAYAATTTGGFWALIDRPSINLVQAVVQRYILPELWDYVLLPILLAPLWQVLAIPGIILALVCHRRTRRWFGGKKAD